MPVKSVTEQRDNRKRAAFVANRLRREDDERYFKEKGLIINTESINIKTVHVFAYWILVGKPEGKRPLGRPRLRGVDNINMDIKEIGWDGVDWIALAQDRD
jgi:hypothetical protein